MLRLPDLHVDIMRRMAINDIIQWGDGNIASTGEQLPVRAC